MGKLSSKKQPETVAQYRRVAYQLVDLVHKELDEITKEDVKYFLIKYPQINKVSDATMDCKRRYLSSLFSYLFSYVLTGDDELQLALKRTGSAA